MLLHGLVVQLELLEADEVRVLSLTCQLVRRVHPLKQLRMVSLGLLKHCEVETVFALRDNIERGRALAAERLVDLNFVIEHLPVHQHKVFAEVFIPLNTDPAFVADVQHLE